MDVSTLSTILFTLTNLNIYRLITQEKVFEQYRNGSNKTKEEIRNRFETFQCGECSPKMVEIYTLKKVARPFHINYY
jgi:hypothetical protein